MCLLPGIFFWLLPSLDAVPIIDWLRCRLRLISSSFSFHILGRAFASMPIAFFFHFLIFHFVWVVLFRCFSLRSLIFLLIFFQIDVKYRFDFSRLFSSLITIFLRFRVLFIDFLPSSDFFDWGKIFLADYRFDVVADYFCASRWLTFRPIFEIVVGFSVSLPLDFSCENISRFRSFFSFSIDVVEVISLSFKISSKILILLMLVDADASWCHFYWWCFSLSMIYDITLPIRILSTFLLSAVGWNISPCRFLFEAFFFSSFFSFTPAAEAFFSMIDVPAPLFLGCKISLIFISFLECGSISLISFRL